MIETKDFDIVGSYNNQIVSTIDSERSVNLFEYSDPRGKKKKSLINTSGLTNTNFNYGAVTGGFRCEFVFQTNLYYVIGDTVFRQTTAGAISVLGTLANTDVGYVGVEANTFQVIFVDGINGYIWDTNANTFTMITDSSFPVAPIDVCYLDGFFTVINGNTNEFELSTFNQGMIWGPAVNNFTADDTAGNNWLTIGASTIGGPATTANFQTGVSFEFTTTGSLPAPLAVSTTYYAIRVDSTHIRVATSYANAIAGTAIVLTTNGTGTQTITSDGQLQLGTVTSHPGTLVACKTLHRRIFFFSQFFTEVWENAGIGTTLPFRRNNSFLIEFGTPAIGCVCVGFDMMSFLSQTRDGLGPVMQVNGTQPIPISTSALDAQLSAYASVGHVTDCRAFFIKENNIIFYRMNFTLANHTFIYNVSQSDPTQGDLGKRWHEEEVLDGSRHPSQTHAYFNGLNYVGHYALPILYVVDSNNYTNDGELIRRMRITKAFYPEGGQRIRIDRIQLDMLQGNLANLQSSIQEYDLFTENDQVLLTEDGLAIALEQGLQIHDPQALFMFLSISKDGGQTYGYSASSPMGNIGQRTFRTLWRKRGTTKRGQAFVGKFEFFDAVPCMIMGATWAYEVLPE